MLDPGTFGSGISATIAAPPNFPADIPLAQQRFVNWATTIEFDAVWTATARDAQDIVRLAEVYKRYIDANYRFIFVGRTDGMPRYYATVRALVVEYDMLPERFVFAGAVPDWELAAYYRTASVYLSLSEHEGDGGRRPGLRL